MQQQHHRSQSRFAIPILERPELGGGSRITGHEDYRADRNPSLDKFLGEDDWTNGVCFNVIVKIIERPRKAQHQGPATREGKDQDTLLSLSTFRSLRSHTCAAPTYIGIAEHPSIKHHIINFLQASDGKNITN